MSKLRSAAALVLTAVVAGACGASLRPGNSSYVPGDVITEEMIAAYKVANAWEVIRKSGKYLASRDDGAASASSIRSRRGRTSLLLLASDVPKVIVDGTRLTDMRELRSIPAASIARIQFLNGMDGTLYEGTNSGAGVIIIVSKSGR